MEKVYIICCNDSMEVASLTSTGLAQKKNELAKAHYNKLQEYQRRNETFNQYKQRVFWHIHEVELI